MRRLLNTLYVTNPDALVRKKDDSVCVSVDGKPVMSVPFHLLEGVVLLGHVGCSTALMGACAEHGVSVILLDEKGRFRARVEGPVSGNVLLRHAQYRLGDTQEACCRLSQRFVAAKIHNSRIVLQHYARDYPEIGDVLKAEIGYLKDCIVRAASASSTAEVRGVEGDAARRYYSVFDNLLRFGGDEVHFSGRTRRPPRDPVNAALSLFYTMLARELTSACESVGLDPQFGYLHTCRPGRMSLALDLMEELRAPLVDRFVVTLFNRRQLGSDDFRVDQGGGVMFRDEALKRSIKLWQQRKQDVLVHPFLKERVELGLIPFIQAQLLARYIRGDLCDYPAMMWR